VDFFIVVHALRVVIMMKQLPLLWQARYVARRRHIPISLISCKRFSTAVWPPYRRRPYRSRDRKNRRARAYVQQATTMTVLAASRVKRHVTVAEIRAVTAEPKEQREQKMQFAGLRFSV